MPRLAHADEMTYCLHELASSAMASTVRVSAGHGALGSGVVWESDGHIITNAHVAFRSELDLELPDGSTTRGTVTQRDPRRDLASIRVPAVDLTPAPRWSSTGLRVGELVMAVGNPLGLSNALAVGVIHAVTSPRPDRLQMIRADLRLAPGYSGGPMLDSRGRVIGINTMVAGGLGLAIASDEVTRFVAAAARPRLELRLQPVQIGSQTGALKSYGLLVVEVVPGGAAAHAGLLVGDVLLSANGLALTDGDRLFRQLELPESELHVDLLRGGRHLVLKVPLDQDHAQKPARAA